MEPIPIMNPFPGAVSFLVPSVGSTQEEAKRLARMGFPRGSLVAAEEQTEGRGRFPERPWLSERGKSLLFTLALAPEDAAIPALPLRVGVALCGAINIQCIRMGTRFPEAPRVKWPNDLLLGDRKAGGVLGEAGAAGTFVGVGLNCNQESFPEALRGRATSLALELGHPVDRWAILEIFLGLLSISLREASWRERFDELLWRRGEAIEFRPGIPESSETVRGILEGVDPEGSLLLRDPGGKLHSFSAGELLVPDTGAVLTAGEASDKVDP